jgi:PAS domain S-box-containing protein
MNEPEEDSSDVARFFLASIVDSSQDSIVTVDFHGIITTWNKAAERLYGYPADEAIGQELVQLTLPQNINEVLANIENVKHGRRVEVFDSVRIKKGGQEMHLEVVMSPVKDEQGRIVGVSTIARDHTAVKLLEQERARLLQEHLLARQKAEEAQRVAEQAQQKAIESEEFKDRFISIVSHEMRTPLNTILAWLSLLHSGSLQEALVSTALDTIQRSTDSLARLVNDLLDVERIRTGKMHINKEAVNLHSVMAQAIQAVQHEAERKSIRINTKEIPPTCTVVGDASRLQQILLNLLGNAIKFTPKGGRVDICVISQGNTVELTVTDTGKGITPEFLPHVFHQFDQADISHSQSYGGLGLGLYIVDELVRLHGGTIHAESEGEGKGATFRLLLPASITP